MHYINVINEMKWIYRTETKASLVVSWMEAWPICGLLFAFFQVPVLVTVPVQNLV